MISLDIFSINAAQLAARPSNYNEAVKAQFYAIPGIRWQKKHEGYVGDPAGIEVAVRICEEAKLAIVASRKSGIDGRTYIVPPRHPQASLMFEFQRFGVAWVHGLLARHGAALLGDDRGLGKGVQAICISDAYAGSKVVVAPAMVVPSWRREIAKWSAQPDSYYVYSYEEFQAASKLSGPKKRAGKRPLLPLPAASIIILDEAQYISESRSKRSQAIHAYCRGNPNMLRLALSGTPINSRVKNIWHLLDVLFPGVFGGFWAFTKRYCDGHYSAIKGRGGEEIQAWEAGGHSNLEELQARLAAFMVRRVKSEVEIELPPKTRSVIDVELPAAVRKSMKAAAAAAGLASQLSDRSISVASLLSHVEEHKLDVACTLAADCIADGRRPLILSTRIASAETLARRLGIALAYGSTPPEERVRILSSASAACSTIDAVQVGITLINFDVIIFVGFDWTPAKLLQAEDRCVAADSPILTPDGWRRANELKVGDAIVNASGLQTTITDAWSKEARHDKLMVTLDIGGFAHPLRVTQDHRILKLDGNWAEAQELRPGDRLASIGNAYGDASVIESLDGMPIDDATLFVIGYYIGDGFVRKPGPRIGQFISFSGNVGKKAPAIEACRAWCESKGLSTKIAYRVGGLGSELRAHSNDIAQWFARNFGRICREKKVPAALQRLNTRQARLLLDGLIASDGYVRGNRVEYSSVNRRLMANIACIMAAAGYKPLYTVSKDDAAHILAYSVIPTAGYCVTSVKFTQPAKHDGRRERVYDFTVADGASFVLGLTPVHNCHRIGQPQPCHIYYLCGVNSIDEIVRSRVIDRLDQFEKVLGSEDSNLRAALNSISDEEILQSYAKSLAARK